MHTRAECLVGDYGTETRKSLRLLAQHWPYEGRGDVAKRARSLELPPASSDSACRMTQT
jgi:hypothetical protein